MHNPRLDGTHLRDDVDSRLADFSQKNKTGLGRKYPETPDPNRLPFQRDRDRIIHTASFRRLQGKMQVVSPKFGDHFRNRLTHSIEVSQISRDLARQLKLNEDLSEAISLAHDLGHPPFGHTGERILNRKMQKLGSGFDHNKQSLRIVENFERRYLNFPGLNLSREVLDGIQKHETFFDRPSSRPIYSPHLESQLVDISDEIAYLSADLEDGLRGGFFSIQDLMQVSITQNAITSLEKNERHHRPTIIRRVIRLLLEQIVSDTKINLKKHRIKTLEDVQKNPRKIVCFNAEFTQEFKTLKDFLFRNFYGSTLVRSMTEKGEKIISEVFDFLYDHPEKIPASFLPDVEHERRVCDYISGMTDRFLVQFHKKTT